MLKRGEMLVMFPEGTRSNDGELLPFKPGFELLARRTRSRTCADLNYRGNRQNGFAIACWLVPFDSIRSV